MMHCVMKHWTFQPLVISSKEYDDRDDEYGLKRQIQIIDAFKGRKKEYTSVPSCEKEEKTNSWRTDKNRKIE